MRMTRTSLYRHFDKEGRLLYVGISHSFMSRLAQHKGRSHWYWSIANVSVTHYPDRATAERAERRAIRTEAPMHNTVIPRPRLVRTTPRPLVIPFIGPLERRVLGYARGNGRALDGLRAALEARGVTKSLTFVDDTGEVPSDRHNFIRLMKTAQHKGTLVYAANGADFDDEARSLLAHREVELRHAIGAPS